MNNQDNNTKDKIIDAKYKREIEYVLGIVEGQARALLAVKDKEKQYVKDKGMQVIRSHANDFITKRIAKEIILNDGKQTPMYGHPVFIAQHATATCCRECIKKWHNIDKNKEMSEDEIEYIISLLMTWIEKEIKIKN